MTLAKLHFEYGNAICCPGLQRQSTVVEDVQGSATSLLQDIFCHSYLDQIVDLQS